MTLILIEGPDGVGKSTLAYTLHTHKALKSCRLIHKGPPTESSLLDEYLLPLAKYRDVNGNRQHVVLDRWHIGELVYPQLNANRYTERSSLATREELAYLEMFLKSRGALPVYATADPIATYHRRIARREAAVSTAQIIAESQLFDDAVRRSLLTFDVIATDDNTTSTADTAQQIVHSAEVESALYHRLMEFPTYVGTRNPMVLLLGGRGQKDRNIPTAFAPLPGTSGEFLLRALPDNLVCTGALGIANANENDDPRLLWEVLNKPTVIALGRDAYHGCVDSGLTEETSVDVVPHPQYVRRFHHNRITDYGNLIMRVLQSKEDLGSWPRLT